VASTVANAITENPAYAKPLSISETRWYTLIPMNSQPAPTRKSRKIENRRGLLRQMWRTRSRRLTARLARPA
jgi:hypothetical protein